MVRSAGGLGSAARVLLVLGVGAAGGAALTTHLGAQAQDGSAAAVAALEARVAALEKANEEPKFKAPFEVLGKNGQPIFSVTEGGGGGGAELNLGTSDSALITMSTSGDELELTMDKGNNVVRLTNANEGPTIHIAGDGGSIDIKQEGEAPSFVMNQGGEAIFSVDTATGGPQLTLQKSADVVRLVTLPDQTGVTVEGKGTHFQMGAIESVRGFVASRGDIPFAGLGSWGDDKYRVVVYNGSTAPVFLGGFDRDTGKAGLWVSNDSGQNIATITAAPAGGGELKLSPPGGQPIVTLGPAEGGDGASLKLGSGENGLVAKTAGDTATVIARIGGKISEMGVTPKSTGFVVGDDSKPLAALVDNGDGKPFLNIYGGAGGKPVISLGMETGSGLLRTYSNSGELAVIAGAVEAGRGSVKVYDANKIMAGMEAVGSNSSVIYVSSDGDDVAGIYNEQGEGEISIKGKQGKLVKLGSIGDKGTLTLNDGGNLMASMGPTEKNSNPAVRIYDKGNMAFAAGATPNGDGVAIVLAGGKIRAAMESKGANGTVYVLAGDDEVASINATDKPGEGVVVVRKSGVAVAKLGYGTSGGGNVQTTNPAGEGVFSAGYASDGAGEACVYRLTQAGSGRMGCIGLALPSAGMGK